MWVKRKLNVKSSGEKSQDLKDLESNPSKKKAAKNIYIFPSIVLKLFTPCFSVHQMQY